MKSFTTNLQAAVQTSYANNGITTNLGRMFQKTLNGQKVIGAPLNQWLDTFQVYALYPQDMYYNPNTGHLFVLSSTAAALTATNLWVQLFNFSAATSWVPSYVGKVNLNLGNSAASTPTIKGFTVYESGGNITPCVSVTGSVVIEGGTYIAYNLTAASFTVGGGTAYPASGAGQAGYMYFLQDPTALGAAHVATTSWGQALPQFSASSSVNTQVLQANGTFASPAMYAWNLGVSPTVSGIITNGISSLTGGYTTATYGVSTACYLSAAPSPIYYTTFTISSLASAITAGATYTVGGITLTAQWSYAAGSLGIVMTSTTSSQVPTSGTLTLASGTGPATIAYTGIAQALLFNGYALGAGGDQVVLMAGTAAVPTGFTAWVANTLQTTSNVYFTRDVQLVYNFTTTALASGITAGATYTYAGTNGNITLTCSITYGSGVTTVLMNTTNGATIPSSGTLTLASGTGPATITFSAQTSTLYFNAATTSGGAAVAATSTNSGFTMMRAFGISSNTFLQKTGTLTAITGGALVSNTMNYCKPISSPANTTLQGLDCISFQATTALYMFKISDLVSLGTTWPSLNTAGVSNTGSGTDYITPSCTQGEYCGAGLPGDIDQFVFVSNTSTFYMKPYRVAGLTYTAVFGALETSYYAGQNPVTVPPGVSAVTQLHVQGGFMFVATTSPAGQIGITITDIGSDAIFGYSAVISPVLTNQQGSQLQYVNSIQQDYHQTGEGAFWLRTGASVSDAAFSSASLPSFATLSGGVSNGWTLVPKSVIASAYALNAAYQWCVTPMVVSGWPVSPYGNNSGSPVQIQDILTTMLLPGESVDDLAPDIDSSTQGTGTPSYFAWTVVNVPSTLPTNLVIYGYPVGSTAQNVSDSWSSNPTRFQYYNGTTWANLTSISQLYTVGYKLRYNIASPPGVETLMAVRYS